MTKICVIGLGYVGLPLAISFAKKFDVVGYDVSEARIDELRAGVDRTDEVDAATLQQSTARFTNDSAELEGFDFYIVTVPTPIELGNKPDFSFLKSASRLVGSKLKKGAIVVYESTVYPGATEEICVPILEEISGFRFNSDFFVGYSPERINPGDKNNRLESIVKVTSGSTAEARRKVDLLYSEIITAGTFSVSSIRAAEASKIIENTQRDVNIALINEFLKIFSTMDLDTQEILQAAATKWNFIPFTPGLVGGHCIGVDPYYLAYKAECLGINPQMVLSGRRTNDEMHHFFVRKIIKELMRRELGHRILIMGCTFKENCPDIRNSKVFDLIFELKDYGIQVDVTDPYASVKEVEDLHGINLISLKSIEVYDAIVVTVSHDVYVQLGPEKISDNLSKDGIIFDLKSIFDASEGVIRP